MSAYRIMECGPCLHSTPHQYMGDLWKCLPCSEKRLADVLDEMTNIAAGLHVLYRTRATSESDGSHEAAFAKARELVATVRRRCLP